MSTDQLLESPEADKTGTSDMPGAEVDDSAQTAKFPLNIIYEFQDLLNNHLTVLKGAQTMVCLYLCQIFYIHLHKQSGMEVISAVGFNVLSAIVAMYLSHRSLLRKYEASPETAMYPELPSFNSLYAFFIPYSFVVLLSDPSDPFFQVNLSLTNFSLKNLHPVAKVLSAFVYNFMFGDSKTLDIIQFGQVVWIYLLVDYALTMWNEECVSGDDDKTHVRRTLDATEIHLIGIFMVNLLANYKVHATSSNLPMVITRVLTIALIGTLAISAPLYYGYLMLEKGVVRSVSSLAVVSVSGATFYFLTNYTFQLFVAEQEVLHWLFDFITSSKLRLQLLQGWLLAFGVTVPVVFFLAARDIISLNLRRKLWHFALVPALAYPALVAEPTFSAIAVLGSVFIFVAIECLRCTRITFLGDFLYHLLRLFQDEKDLKGPFNLSYIFLLVGLATPIAYGAIIDDVVSMRSYLGLVALGLGDSFASIVGKRFGKYNWKGESRTVEGTIAYIVVSFFSFVFIDYYLLPESARVQNWENIVIVSLVGGLIEGSASLNDNILIPCMTLIAYELLNKVF
ncbi:hypothetical protein METBIDRAFT_38043 [Metschnikowia bicuspidata var. bicuspidata NRRL YB-4993]|uniref:dolichol kinase n=1 Tax=Metschnikowia bicuspidata var. bicuspidata NRRL YB-4993 TaxID=869754 RepID=A0A1A0HKH4_9ASCO|nr:hypothetical protein METBIDRAFT_38043 [Metschnikowia bicuspidata var. bicuspidata NRRL YB-4993]OBA24308.1 hypothetical protein METBIDRAFT_38043 [Metschnikowia bicuspidata var. bicuspidata NRRL YB-4993]